MSTGPFRWDLVTPAQLGALLDGIPAPPLAFAPMLAACAGKVVARGANGDLAFVGRSLDSMYDLLSGALSSVPEAPALVRVPLSFERPWAGKSRRPFTPDERDVARASLAAAGLTPFALARRSQPVTFVDVAHTGGTFGELHHLLRDWVDDDRAQWDVIRTKVRYLGVVSRKKTSPKTFRWAQHQAWTGELPGKSVVSVSLEPQVWSYFGNHQLKLTRSFTPDRWLADTDGPGRSEQARTALAEAVAVVSFGRSPSGRRLIAEAMDGEPALSQPWLRTLRSRLLSAGLSA